MSFLLFFTVTMRLSLFLLNEHDDDDDVSGAVTSKVFPYSIRALRPELILSMVT